MLHLPIAVIPIHINQFVNVIRIGIYFYQFALYEFILYEFAYVNWHKLLYELVYFIPIYEFYYVQPLDWYNLKFEMPFSIFPVCFLRLIEYLFLPCRNFYALFWIRLIFLVSIVQVPKYLGVRGDEFFLTREFFLFL